MKSVLSPKSNNEIKRKVAVIHQPLFVPWLGFFNKLLHADVYICQDNVQYRKKYFHNRSKIKKENSPSWITIPVLYSLNSRINQVCTHEDLPWRRKITKTIEQNYKNASFFSESWPTLEDIINKKEQYLSKINEDLIRQILSLLNLENVQILRSSDLLSDEKSHDLISLCETIDATHLIVGEGGWSQRHNADILENSGIKVIQQEFKQNHPVYEQMGSEFVSGLSVLDAIFNVGPRETKRLLSEAWRPSE